MNGFLAEIRSEGGGSVQVVGLAILAGVVCVSVYLTKKICEFGEKAYERGVIETLERDKEFREMIKERFGWK